MTLQGRFILILLVLVLYAAAPFSVIIFRNLPFIELTVIGLKPKFNKCSKYLVFLQYKCSYTFNMFHGFWSLKQVVLTVDQTPPHILFPKTEVGAPRGYSFKCPQKTIFQDAKGKVTLELTDFQVQAFRPGSFETAIYCIPSITPIIFSGLFVTILLVSVLLTSIYALLNIEGFKTFDTSKMEILYTHQE